MASVLVFNKMTGQHILCAVTTCFIFSSYYLAIPVNASRVGFTHSAEHQLLQNLSVENRSVPQSGEERSFTVSCVEFYIDRIIGLNQKTQALSMLTKLSLLWTDKELEWQSNEKFASVKQLHVLAGQTWLPDTALINDAQSAGPFENRWGYSSHVVIYSDGSTLWRLSLNLSSLCLVDMSMFPFDRQVCELVFASWTYDRSKVIHKITKEVSVGRDVLESSEWVIDELTTRQVYLDRPYSQTADSGLAEKHEGFKITMRLHRKSFHYIFNVFIPIIALVTLTVSILRIPPRCYDEKITLGLSIFIAQTWYLLMVAPNLPAAGSSLPLISIFVATAMGVTCSTLTVTVLVVQVHNHRKMKPSAPRFLYACAKRILKIYQCIWSVCWPGYKKISTNEIVLEEKVCRTSNEKCESEEGLLANTIAEAITCFKSSDDSSNIKSLCDIITRQGKQEKQPHNSACSRCPSDFLGAKGDVKGLLQYRHQLLTVLLIQRQKHHEEILNHKQAITEQVNEWITIATAADLIMYWFTMLVCSVATVVILHSIFSTP